MHLAFKAAPTPSPAISEGPETLPSEVAQLLVALPDPAREAAWQAFVERYSRLMLKVAFAFAPGYDGAMDRYLFILDELRRDEYARLRRFAADGRGRFTTWLVVVARRLCVDHYRRCYGRERAAAEPAKSRALNRQVRRRLADLTGDHALLDSVANLVQSDPIDALDHEARCRALQQAVGLLDPSDRLLLRLRYEEDLTAREIATLLGLPTPFHVYRRIRGVCTLLKERLSRRAERPQEGTESNRRLGIGSIAPGPNGARPERTRPRIARVHPEPAGRSMETVWDRY